jgi:hypothetical protein
MKQQTLSPKMIRQRKFLLVLPLIVLPFLTLFFWALGGGKADPANALAPVQKGLNTRLPDARLKDSRGLTKMSYYDKAAQDSDKLRQQMKSDPYYRQPTERDTAGLHFPKAKQPIAGSPGGATLHPTKLSGDNNAAVNEARVYQKLSALQLAINRPVSATGDQKANQANVPVNEADNLNKNQSVTEDPELKQMNGLLEKILDIQHPDRLKEKPDPKPDSAPERFKAVPAVIDGNQKVTQGTVVRIRLLDSVILDGQLIPKGQLIYGSGTLYNQRLTLNLKIVHIGYNIMPVDLTVFDMTDGLEGINVPEAITSDAVKEGAVSGVQGVEFMSLDPSLATQMAGAGLNTAKGLFSKKVKRVKARLKDGHLLLLRDNKSMRQLSAK